MVSTRGALPATQTCGRYEVRTEWWLDHSNLSALARWLIDRAELPLDQVPHFLEKPWKWGSSWLAMRGVVAANDVEGGS
ncbi:MAG TPA: hypothetical protein VKU41_04820 [Polyangiaceae bacterium]|nr:hypothetical protein [Polyangiaceae bacterium]